MFYADAGNGKDGIKMSGMTSIYVGVSGIHAAQTALNTTAHNLANVYTPGYTRQLAFSSDKRYSTYSRNSNGIMQVGLGVNASSTSRVRSLLLDLRYRKEVGRQGFYDAQYEAVSEVQTLIGELEGVRFQESLENLWGAISEMAKTPDSLVYRSELVMNAEMFLDRAKSIYDELIGYQKNLNTKVQETVDVINAYGEEINELNKQISGYEAAGEAANDLRDRRDLLLDKLSNLINISYVEEENNYVTVKAEGVPFVTEGGVFHMETAELDADKGSNYLSCIWPHLDNQEVFNLTEEISTANKNDIGTLKGYLLARGDFVGKYTDVDATKQENYDLTTPQGQADYQAALDFYNRNVDCSVIVKTQSLFDALINGIVTTINDILSPTTTEVPDGVTSFTDADGNVYQAGTVKILDMNTSTGDDGKMPPEELFSRAETKRFIEVTGDDGNTYYMYNEYNTFGKESLYTLSNISMNQTIVENYDKLPFKTLEGDNDMAKGQQLVEAWDLKFANLDPDNTTKLTFKEYYKEMMYSIGNTGNLYQSIALNQYTTASQVDEARTQITGVSSEEELANMIRFQSAWDASSRYVTTIAEMLEYIIEKLG